MQEKHMALDLEAGIGLRANKAYDPRIRLYFPVWWHHHGEKIAIVYFDREAKTLTFVGSAARLCVKLASSVFAGRDGWFIEWEIFQCKPLDEAIRGRCRFSDQDLESAFGLSDDSGKFGQWLIEQYGAEVAEQGKYIRWKDFLNIPCPGTGGDGDPNISIRITKEIQEAIRQLLEK